MNSIVNTVTVLVVDDDSINREVVARKLVEAGFVTTLAASGQEALDCLALAEFDAVVTDVRMPGMSGIDLLRNIRLRFPPLPVLLMTGLIEEETREDAITWNAAALFEKPVSRAELIAAVKAAIEDSALRAGFAADPEAAPVRPEGGAVPASLRAAYARQTATAI
jgi:CheY-like chemotaxis protein